MDYTERNLKLIETALDEFDSVPLPVTVRRLVRIANALGDSRNSIRFSMELRLIGGKPEANRADIERLMKDPSKWGTLEGDHEDAFNDYVSDRRHEDGVHIWAHDVDTLESLANNINDYAQQQSCRAILAIIRNRAFNRLCSYERVTRYSQINHDALQFHQQRVDTLLAENIPEALTSFNIAYQRLHEAAAAGRPDLAAEHLSHAVTSCRRILKAVVDHVQPVEKDKPVSDTGAVLDDEKYRNRLREYFKNNSSSSSSRDAFNATVDALMKRFIATDSLASKGVHAVVAREEAELCAASSYLVCGEILAAHVATTESGAADF